MSKKDTLDLSTPIFVTGIGTDVGKTIVSAILCEWLLANYWKPIPVSYTHLTLPTTT